MNERLYGFKVKSLPHGERVPDAIWPVRLVMHVFWLAAFRVVPTMWLLERSGKWRNRIGRIVISQFGWWAFQHQKYRGYSAEMWERFVSQGSGPEAL